MSQDSTRRSAHTRLHDNPFAILGATTRDGRQRLIELAEEKVLFADSEACQKARADLTNPRSRLSAEVAWLPGVSPRRVAQLMELLRSSPLAIWQQDGVASLAHCNLMSAAFELIGPDVDSQQLTGLIATAARLSEALDAEQALCLVNEDRSVAGFPEVKVLDQVQKEIAEQKRQLRNAINQALNGLETSELVHTMTQVVARATSNGQVHAPELVDELVDSYAIEAQEFLKLEALNVQRFLDALQRAGASGARAVAPLIDQLEPILRNWDRVAQPLQLSFKARGLRHDASADLAYKLREVSLTLFNEYDLLEAAQRMTDLIGDVFSELADYAERAKEDGQALEDIRQRRYESQALEPLRELAAAILASIKRAPKLAHHEGERMLQEGVALFKAMPVKVTSPVYKDAGNILAGTLMSCAIAHGNETSDWAPGLRLLEQALGYVSDPEIRRKIQANLDIVRDNLKRFHGLTPVKKAPSLQTINGIGFTIYGKTDNDPSDGSYIGTYYFCVLFIPLFPLARYRVIPTGGGYRFLGKGPLRTFDRWHIAGTLALLAWVFFN